MTNAGKVTNPLFGLGKPNDAFAQYFIGESFQPPDRPREDHLPR